MVDVEPYLRALGFDTESVLRVDVDHQDDVAVVKWARKHRRILLTHDKHQNRDKRKASRDSKRSGKPTPSGWYSEVADRGGKVIEIAGAASSDPLEVVGMLIQRRAVWRAFFDSVGKGVVYVHAQGAIEKPPHKLRVELAKYKLKLDVPPPERRLKQIQPPRRRKRRPPIDRGLTPPFPDLLEEAGVTPPGTRTPEPPGSDPRTHRPG